MDSNEQSAVPGHPPAHPWRARLIVGIIMLVFAFIGLVVTDVWRDGSWNYWRVMSPAYALMSLWLSWYVRRSRETVRSVTIWHELAHWAGLIGAIWLMSGFVELGLIGRFEASMQVLVLLALTVFTNGIYTEHSFIVVGIVLGLLAAVVAFINKYLFAVMIPIILIGCIGLYWLFHRRSK